MICGVPVPAIAEPHPVCWPGGRLRELLPMALPPAGYGLVGPVAFPNTELGFVGEFGFVGPVGAPADWLPNTELGLVGELGFVGPVGVPAEPPAELLP
jgi:hypothetical protein